MKLKNTLKPLKYKIQDFIDYIRYNIPNSIRNLITWFPIIWKDRNWDYVFIFHILKFKISLTRKRIEKYDRHVGSKRYVKDMKIAETVLDRLIKDNYEENYLKSHYEKWGEIEITSKPVEGTSGKFQLYELDHKMKNVKTKEDKEQEKKEFSLKLKKARNQRKSELKFLFEFLNKKIEQWWD